MEYEGNDCTERTAKKPLQAHVSQVHNGTEDS